VTLSTPCALSPEAAREQWQSIFAGLLRCRAACHEDGLSRNSRDFVHRLTRANAPCYPRRVGLLTFWSYLLQIAITVVIIVIIVILVRSRYCIPMPAARNSKRAPDCSRPSAGGSAQGSFGPSTTGGSYTEPGPATLPTGATMGLSSSLTLIVTKGDIVIDGSMLAGMAAQPGDPPIDVILVAEEGDVIVSQTGVVSGSSSNSVHASDTGMYALATSPAGANGGIIKLSGVNVNIAGHVTGMVAGWGGDADATGLSVAGIGGRAIAVAGEGGAGGDVVICATDSIAISGTLEGGLGGISTFATARAANASIACAELGSAGPGGDVWLRGRSSGSACPVFFTGAGRRRAAWVASAVTSRTPLVAMTYHSCAPTPVGTPLLSAAPMASGCSRHRFQSRSPPAHQAQAPRRRPRRRGNVPRTTVGRHAGASLSTGAHCCLSSERASRTSR
jgi:hypothetical protein